MAIPDRLENKEAIEAAKAEILAAIAQTDGKLDVGISAVKNVQRGSTTFSNDTMHIIQIDEINPNKASLNLVGGYVKNNEIGSLNSSPSGYIKDATSIVIYGTCGTGVQTTVHYEIIEYY